jgi:hypothetical protein
MDWTLYLARIVPGSNHHQSLHHIHSHTSLTFTWAGFRGWWIPVLKGNFRSYVRPTQYKINKSYMSLCVCRNHYESRCLIKQSPFLCCLKLWASVWSFFYISQHIKFYRETLGDYLSLYDGHWKYLRSIFLYKMSYSAANRHLLGLDMTKIRVYGVKMESVPR